MSQLLRASSVPTLVGLEEELTCAICLCVFESPVTTPCGHNFCLPCLEMTWGDLEKNFSCPQCRSCFDSRPELKKNTVLCRVVEEFQGTLGGPPKKDEKAKQRASSSPPAVACDSCLQAAATKTCFTCMASFCQEHLKPHLESPAFKSHQLASPVADLQQRKCQAHSKLLEFYCKEHGSCICCFCLVTHKKCVTVPLEEAKEEKESQLKQRLTELYALNEKADQSLNQVRMQQKQISDTARRKLDLLKSEFLEMIALIEEEEKESVKKVLAEEKRVRDKYDFVYKVLGKKKNEIQGERDQIEMALTEVDDIAFLKKSAKLRQLPFKDVFIPKIDLDQKLIHAIYQKAFGLKESVKQFLTHPKDKNTEGSTQSNFKPQTNFLQPGKKKNESRAAKGDDQPPDSSQEKATEEATASGAPESKARRRPAKRSQSPNQRGRSSSRTQLTTLESFLAKSREELLEFASQFTLDYKTAHQKVLLSERNTKVSVADTPQNYQYHPQRFSYCSQVVAFQCFKRGIHYWEVEVENNSFSGVGVCYGSMARHGVESRLGRNDCSWCIEWCNGNLSAWHKDVGKNLPPTKVKKIGVLLHYEGGFLIFFGISTKTTLLYKFQAQFTEALYPAFWVFSSKAAISICQLK
ncbi:E3 ubiquitin/ISG15 ligase TRIM25-like isoform X2 [Varanus komodoensis]|uniref:Tripartite motif containing 25 n=1 Tax=Varanus komodoensis TaxID=61221 RepID=A0A8D2IL44_VARKO|nr:E3 ubiquitin/ISG15 ligase TRIM25-like isoform X2 [Varanus komodoensis]